MVILPFLAGRGRGAYAAIFSFIGVMLSNARGSSWQTDFYPQRPDPSTLSKWAAPVRAEISILAMAKYLKPFPPMPFPGPKLFLRPKLHYQTIQH